MVSSSTTLACADKYESGPKEESRVDVILSINDRPEIDVKPEMKPEPAGGAYAFLCAFERPLIPSAWTVLFTYSVKII
jgi:hypothetical protein